MATQIAAFESTDGVADRVSLLAVAPAAGDDDADRPDRVARGVVNGVLLSIPVWAMLVLMLFLLI